MGLWDTTNLLKNGYFSTDTSITGSCSLRNDGKSILVGGLVVQGNLTATSTQTIDFGANLPKTTGTPTVGSDLVNKTYADSAYHPIGSYVDLSSNQTIGGVKSFTNNLRAIATTGDVFQAYKNTGVGNAGHVLINGSGDLLYYDSSASLTKWKLDPSGNLTIGNIDISGTLISKTTTGDFIRSNSGASQYFFATNGGQIGYADSTSNIGVGWNINSNGTARFKSSTNSFKYWEFAGNLLRYYNLGGAYSISMNGDSGAISSTSLTTTGAISGLSLTTTGGITATATQNINFGSNVPTSSGTPTTGSDLINKTYGDANYHPIGSYVDTTTNQTVGGIKTFTSNLVAYATTGDVFQAFKNNGIGNTGRVIINGGGDLLYYDSTLLVSKWKLDPTGLLTTTGGITASASQTITFGSNNPTMGASNINYGTAALRVGTGGSYSQKSIAIGTTSFGTAIQSVAIGDQALNASGSTASYSVAIGVNSLKLATGERNTAIGTDSLPLLTGTGNGANTAIGNLTGTKLTSGVNNLFLGLGSGSGVTQGSNNLIVGSSMVASISPDTGIGINNNCIVGNNAMAYIKNNCINNCAIGSYALYSEVGYSGDSTVAIGPNAGVRSLGSNCVFIGENATVSPANSVFDNSIAIGYNTTVTASNQIRLGIASQKTIIGGELEVVGIIGSGLTTTLGDISCGAITTSGDINSGSTNVYANVMICNRIDPANGIDIGGSLGKIQFTSAEQNIRIGVSSTFLTDTTTNNINIGNSSVALGGENVVMGFNAKGGTTGLGGAAKGQGTVQVGAYCDSEGSYSVGVGHNTTSYQEGVAIGRNAVAQMQCVAIGLGANAGQAQNIAIGYNATTPFTTSHAIGTGIATTAQGQFALGSTANSFLFSQTYYPWEVSPTTITATSTLPGAPYYGWYLVATSAAGVFTLTIPVITAQMVGLVLNFRKTNANAFGSTMNITCSAGNTYLPLNSVTAQVAGFNSAFIGGTSTTGRICFINATQFAILN